MTNSLMTNIIKSYVFMNDAVACLLPCSTGFDNLILLKIPSMSWSIIFVWHMTVQGSIPVTPNFQQLGRGRIAQWIAYLLLARRPRVRISAFPRIFQRDFFLSLLDVAELIDSKKDSAIKKA